MDTHLKPCPFCGSAPELDTRRNYMSLEGRPGTGIAIYCANNDPHCSAEMMFCREDMPGCSTDDLVAALAELHRAALERVEHYAGTPPDPDLASTWAMLKSAWEWAAGRFAP